jgi:uncharacterized membrane protein YedE/YeeE
MPALLAFLSGLIFAIGLGISGMTKPHKVIDFLDLFGDWDYSLLFVMVGAIAVSYFAFGWIRLRKAPLFAESFHIPNLTDIDARLIGGAAIFGVGWGIGGFCPGPGLVSLASFNAKPIVFSIAMVIGIGFFRMIEGSLSSESKD